jgi:hypothetical protein
LERIHQALVIAMLVTTMPGCSGRERITATPLDFRLQITSATVQRWAGGPAHICGARRIVHVVKPGGVALEITSVWLGDREKGRALAAELLVSGGVSVDPKVEAEVEEFAIRFSASYPCAPVEDPALEEGVPGNLPVEFVSGAVIWYTADGGPVRSLIVEEFEELDVLLYP